MQLLKRVWHNIVETDVLGLAAQTAYFFFFSLFPLLLCSAPLLSLVGNKQQTVGVVMRAVAEAVPPDAYLLIQSVVDDIVFGKNATGILSVGAVLTLWAASNVFSALSNALNHAFAVVETRPWWKRMLMYLGFAIAASIVAAIATVVLLDGEQVIHAIAHFVGLHHTTRLVWTIVQFPIAVAFVVVLTWGVYYILPNLRLTFREALVGALVATGAWLVVTLLFRVYVQHFGVYNRTYGTIGAVVVLLTWMYLTMLAVLCAGVLAAELHARHTGKLTAADISSTPAPGAPVHQPAS